MKTFVLHSIFLKRTCYFFSKAQCSYSYSYIYRRLNWWFVLHAVKRMRLNFTLFYCDLHFRKPFHVFSLGHATLNLAVSVIKSVSLSVTIPNCERFSHILPYIRPCLEVLSVRWFFCSSCLSTSLTCHFDPYFQL